VKQHDLRPPEGATRERKRVGRGYGSGHGKTSGRGQKGQNSRTGGGVRPGFEGGQSPLILRMPYKRGFTNPFRKHYEIVNLSDLEKIGPETQLTPETMLSLGLVDHKQASTQDLRVKLLGNGDVSAAYTITVHKASAGARAKIEAAGGTVTELEPADEPNGETA
jgi:large subunit ribosomal protein L15